MKIVLKNNLEKKLEELLNLIVNKNPKTQIKTSKSIKFAIDSVESIKG